MEVSVTSDRRVIQIGRSLGERDGCTVEPITAETAAAITTAIPQISGDGAVILSPDHGTVSVAPPSPEWQTAQQAAAQQAATLKAQTIAAFTTEYRSLSTAAGPLTAALMLHQSMEVARQSFGIVIDPATDLPADLQQGLASLPA